MTRQVHHRYPWVSAMESFALSIAERTPDESEFMAMWMRLGTVVRFLVTHDPARKAPAPISSETGAVSAIADHSSGESVPSTPDGAARPPDIHPTVEADGAAR